MKIYAYTFKSNGQIVACGTSISAARKDLARESAAVGGINATQCRDGWIEVDAKRVGDVTGDTRYTRINEADAPSDRNPGDGWESINA